MITRYIKKGRTLYFLISSLTLAGLMGLSVFPGFAQNQSDLNTKIASVNGVPITKKDFIWAYTSEEQRMTSMGKLLSMDETRQLKKDAFDQLINREVLYQESQKKKIQVSESRIEEEFSRIRASMMSDIDLETIKKELDMQEKDIKNEFRRVFAIETLLAQELHIDDSVTEKESRDFYEKNPDKFVVAGPVRVRHILVEVKEDAAEAKKSEARKKIAVVAEKLKHGEDFAKLATSYSDDSSNKMGGDIGWIEIGRTVKSFEDAAFALKPGEVSGVVETPYGYHLIQMIEKRPETVFSYETMREKIEEYLKNQKKAKIESNYIAEIKKSIKIQQFVDPSQIQQ